MSVTPIEPPAPAASPRAGPSRHRGWVVALLILMAIATSVHAVLAARGKSSTYDEPVHALSSWLIVNEGDFRVNPEHPALWKYVAGAGLIGWPLSADLGSAGAIGILRQLELQWPWTIDTLYRRNPVPGDGEALVARARMTTSAFLALAALVVARWSWAWGGPVAAVVAVALFALDPNLLAHGGLCTNDVAATLWFALAAYLTWRLGTGFDARTAILLALVCAAGIGTKFTCLLLAPMVGVPLLYRALDRSPWTIGRRDRTAKVGRIGVVLALGVGIVLVAWLSLWPLYQFQSDPTRVGARFNDGYARLLLGYNKALSERDANLSDLQHTAEELDKAAMQVKPGVVAGTFLWLTEQRLVPQAWGFGLNYANARSFTRGSYLMGEYSNYGFTSYFPLALLFKTPLATTALLLLAGVGGLSLAAQRIGDPAARWKLVCLLVPPCVYFGIACASPLNIGVRHVLPVLPPMYVAAGVMLARLLRGAWPARAIVVGGVALVAMETLAAFPNYIPFFNCAVGGTRGGLALLGDSNLDWGQDLAPLARWYKPWRAANPNEPFYLSYFGTVPPGAYGIDYVDAAPGYDFDGVAPTLDLNGGIYAVSATQLQAIYWDWDRDRMKLIREVQPWQTINDTIYLYRMPRTSATRPTTGVTK